MPSYLLIWMEVRMETLQVIHLSRRTTERWTSVWHVCFWLNASPSNLIHYTTTRNVISNVLAQYVQSTHQSKSLLHATAVVQTVNQKHHLLWPLSSQLWLLQRSQKPNEERESAKNFELLEQQS